MRLDEVTNISYGLHLRFANGLVVDMEVGEAEEAEAMMKAARERRMRGFGEVPEPCAHKHWRIDQTGARCRDCGQLGAPSNTPLRRVK